MSEKIPARNNWYFGGYPTFEQSKSDVLASNFEKLTNILLTLFDYEGLPDSVPYYELEKLLLLTGSASMIKVKGIWYANRSGLGAELDAYYHPKKDIVVNPWIDGGYSATLDVDKGNCCLIFNNRLRTSVYDIILKYATMLTEVELSLNLSTKGVRVSNLIVANDDRTKANAEEVLRTIDEGKNLAVIGGNIVFDAIKAIPFEVHYDIEGLTRVRQYIEKSFLKEFGISTNNESKSQYVSDENLTWEFQPSRALISNMFNQRKDDIEKFNKMSGLNVVVKYGEVLKETELHYEQVMSQYDDVTEETEEGEVNDNDESKSVE